VNAAWAIAAPAASLQSIARLRQVPGLTVCESGGEVWLRVPALDDSLAAALKLIPGSRQFTVLPDGQLIAASRLVPEGRLPAASWQLLADWLTLELPPVR
jgi:hypothetical protein